MAKGRGALNWVSGTTLASSRQAELGWSVAVEVRLRGMGLQGVGMAWPGEEGGVLGGPC